MIKRNFWKIYFIFIRSYHAFIFFYLKNNEISHYIQSEQPENFTFGIKYTSD